MLSGPRSVAAPNQLASKGDGPDGMNVAADDGGGGISEEDSSALTDVAFMLESVFADSLLVVDSIGRVATGSVRASDVDNDGVVGNAVFARASLTMVGVDNDDPR